MGRHVGQCAFVICAAALESATSDFLKIELIKSMLKEVTCCDEADWKIFFDILIHDTQHPPVMWYSTVRYGKTKD